MDNAVLNRGGTVSTPSFERIGYDSNIRERTDLRLLDAINYRRAEHAQAKAAQKNKIAKQLREAEEKAYGETLEGINEQLAKAQCWRAVLEKELEKAKAVEVDLLRQKDKALEVKNANHLRLRKKEMERKCKTTSARKLEERGGKPRGVAKSVSPKPVLAPSIAKAVSPRRTPPPDIATSVAPKKTHVPNIAKSASPQKAPTPARTMWGTGPIRIRSVIVPKRLSPLI